MNPRDVQYLLDRVSRQVGCAVYNRCGDDYRYQCNACHKNLTCSKEEVEDYRTLILLHDEYENKANEEHDQR
jgi:hypothetical protein